MLKQKNIPLLRFSEFDGEWVKYNLGDLSISIQSGKDSNDSEGRFPLYGSMGIIGKSANSSYKGKFILVARVGANAGSINIVNGSFGVTDNTLVIENANTIITDFEYYLLTVANLNKYIFGSGQPLVTGGQLKAIKLNVPSKPEQQKIASFFTTIDQKIFQLKHKKNLLEQYKKGVMQKIFSQEIRFKDGNGKEYPKWEKKKIKDLVKIQYGKDQKQISCEDGKYPILGTGGEIGRSNVFLSDKPSVLIGRKGTIDKPRYMDTPFWTVDTLFYTDVFTNTNPKWLYYKFETINWHLYNEASGVPSLSSSTIYNIPINLPPLSEQIKIANFLSSLDEKISNAQKQIEKAEIWKKGLLQKMFV